MVFKAYCRIPNHSGKHIEGSCPEILDDLIEELQGVHSVKLALFLFNNFKLLEFLKELTSFGTKITIVSIPIHGYEGKEVSIVGKDEKYTKRFCAGNVYSETKSIKNIELRIFPHWYVWYDLTYRTTDPPYSLHIKACYAEFEENRLNVSFHQRIWPPVIRVTAKTY